MTKIYKVFKSTISELDIHNGEVEIIRQLDSSEVDEEVGKMYECLSPQGKFQAFEDELNDEVI